MSEGLSRADYYQNAAFAPIMAGVILSVYTEIMQKATAAAEMADKDANNAFVLKMIRSSPENGFSPRIMRAEDFSIYAGAQSLFRTIRISWQDARHPYVAMQLRPTNEAQLHPSAMNAVKAGRFSSLGAYMLQLQQKPDDFYLNNVPLSSLTDGESTPQKIKLLIEFQELDELTSVVQSAPCIF